MTDPKVHRKKYFDHIEVFGSNEKRSWIHGPKSPKRFFINEEKFPVRNPFDRIDWVVMEEGMKMFDNLVWLSWHEDGNIPTEAKNWFAARVKSLNLEHILILFVIVEDLEVKMMQ